MCQISIFKSKRHPVRVMREKCGVFAALSENAPRKAYYALIALQHRGQESAGISVWKHRIRTVSGLGLVQDVFNGKTLSSLRSSLAIGHVRYSTSGSLTETQPLETECCGKRIAVAHNGTLTNFLPLRKKYENKGVKFYHSVDSELLGDFVSLASGGDWRRV